MPTYEYRCSDCTTSFEIVQKFSDAALTECPECDGELRKVFSAVGVVFKGSGFYATDNRTKGSSNAAKSESSKAESSKAESGSSDSASGSGSGSKSGASGATSDAAGSASASSKASPAASPAA